MRALRGRILHLDTRRKKQPKRDLTEQSDEDGHASHQPYPIRHNDPLFDRQHKARFPYRKPLDQKRVRILTTFLHRQWPRCRHLDPDYRASMRKTPKRVVVRRVRKESPARQVRPGSTIRQKWIDLPALETPSRARACGPQSGQRHALCVRGNKLRRDVGTTDPRPIHPATPCGQRRRSVQRRRRLRLSRRRWLASALLTVR